MYVESIELIRELVNNAYDADATEVYVAVTPESVTIEDNGSGMSERGLKQFFTVGSEEKRIHSVSPRFGRKRIGQFGIGKFAALAAADKFVVESQKGKWLYSVVFDREEWQKSEKWELPIVKEQASPLRQDGTKVILTKLKRHFSVSDVERYLKESVPLRAKKFAVFLNGKRISARYIPGRRFSISIKTVYGSIEGEIVVAVKAGSVDKPGIECRVKQVLIRREFFDLERAHPYGLSRITGEVNADFLPVTSSRNDFLRDSLEFKLFEQVMRPQLEKILKELKKESETKYLKRLKEELKEVLSKIRTALQLHPELAPSGRAIAIRRKRKGELAGSALPRVPAVGEKKEEVEVGEKPKEKEGGVAEKKEKVSLPKPAVVRRIKLERLGVSVALVSLGADGPETFSEGNLIYINSDHSLYQKFYPKKDQFELHLLRLVAQEIVMMKKMKIGAKEAFECQSKLLTDAICGLSAHKKEGEIL